MAAKCKKARKTISLSNKKEENNKSGIENKTNLN